jgi:hypothetical protein
VSAETQSPLAFLVDPVSFDEFLAEYWERRPLCLSRKRHDYFDDLFSLDAFDELLARGDVWHPNVRVFLAGEQLPPGRFGLRWPYGHEVHDRLVDRNELLRLFRQGATINLLGIERTSATVMTLSKRLELEAGFPVHTTAFVSPPEAANIPPHYDMVDVLVAQISGTKEWGVWEPDRTLPLTTDTAGRVYSSDDERVAPERLLGRYLLEPGDTLYVPRGALHEAVTTDETSLHLAFGINPHRWYDLVESVTRQAISRLAETVEFRQALPIGYHECNHRGVSGNFEATLDAIAVEFSASVKEGLPLGLAVLDERYLQGRSTARPGQLADIGRLGSLALTDRLVVRPHLAYGITRGQDRIRLVFHQKTLSFGPYLRSPLEFVSSGRPFAVADIQGLSDQQRLQFARRLLAEGFLAAV